MSSSDREQTGSGAFPERAIPGELPAGYRAFFDCFNRQRFFEAHEVLEPLWLAERRGARGGFYKGLIQLAGAFVHLQRGRAGPAAALFKLARANLEACPPRLDRLEVGGVLGLIEGWLGNLEAGRAPNELLRGSPPRLRLLGEGQ